MANYGIAQNPLIPDYTTTPKRPWENKFDAFQFKIYNENWITLDALMDGGKDVTILENVLQYNENRRVLGDRCEICIWENNKEDGNGKDSN
jgi:hypothetical protein